MKTQGLRPEECSRSLVPAGGFWESPFLFLGDAGANEHVFIPQGESVCGEGGLSLLG